MNSIENHEKPVSRSQAALNLLLQRTSEIEKHKLKDSRFREAISATLETLSPEDLAELFVAASFLASAGQPLIDQHWMQTHDLAEHESEFQKYLAVAIRRELAPLSFLSALFENLSPSRLKIYDAMAHAIVETIGAKVRSVQDENAFRAFAVTAMRGMERLARFENEMQEERKTATAAFETRQRHLQDSKRAALEWPEDRPLPSESVLIHSLYRAFDEMDEVLGIDYGRDKGMRVDPSTTERLYEGAGLGVQTSYSTLLHALHVANPAPGSLVIDLGSGYGRVGFVIGLLRPDVRFIGYEYVGHRVEVSQACADRAGLSSHVRFLEQDLSDPAFKIPEAEIYYMYDPFSQETYKYVFQQLKEIGRRKAITVITKGRASGWLGAALEGETWSFDLTHDEGTLGIFRSAPEGEISERTKDET